jgi:hypothetical protein
MSGTWTEHAGELRRDGFTVMRGFLDTARTARLREIADGIRTRYLRRDPVRGERGFLVCPWSIPYVDHPGFYEDAPDWWFPQLMDLLADPRLRALWRGATGEEPDFVATELYFDPPLPYALDAIMQTLAAPDGAGRWHRDAYELPEDDVERAALLEGGPARQGGHLLEVVLVPSDAFEYVPGSHVRWDTPPELVARKHGTSMAERTQPLSGARRISLDAGDVALIDVNGIHRGWYTHGVTRRTVAMYYLSRDRLRRYPDEDTYRIELDPARLELLGPETRAFFQHEVASRRG